MKCKVGDLVMIDKWHGTVLIGRVLWKDRTAVLVAVPFTPLPTIVWTQDILAVGDHAELIALRNAISAELKQREAAWIAAKKSCAALKDALDTTEIKKLIRQVRQEAA